MTRWFEEKLPRYNIDGSPLLDEEKTNPYINTVCDEDWEEISIPQVRKELSDGSTDVNTGVSSE